MARVCREGLDAILGARTSPPSETETSGLVVDWGDVDWEDVYRARPETLENILKRLGSSLSPTEPLETAGSAADAPGADSRLGRGLREGMLGIETIVRNVESLVEPDTGMVPEEALKGGA